MLFLLRMDSTAFHFLFLHIPPLHRTSTILSPHWCFASRKGLTGRASAMHIPFFYLEVTRSIRSSRWFCPHFILSAQMMVDPRSIIGGRQCRDIRERR